MGGCCIYGTNSRLCCRGLQTLRPPVVSSTTTTHRCSLTPPGLFTHSQEHLASQPQLWLLMTCRSPDQVAMRVSTPRPRAGRFEMPPLAAGGDGPAVCLCWSSDFIYITWRLGGRRNHPSSVQVFTLIPVKKIKAEL